MAIFKEFRPFYQLDRPKGRRLVVPDIHGCYGTLLNLMNEISLTKDDQLFFLGDFIDRGPLSGAVLDYVINLQRMDYQVYPLRGNHEQMLLDAARLDPVSVLNQYLDFNNTRDLLDGNNDIKPQYVEFMDKLPYYYELEDYYLVHAGFNFTVENPFTEYDDMIWIRKFSANKRLLKEKKLIHGHTPTNLDDIKYAIDEKKPVIPLDNGCVYYNSYAVGLPNWNMGNLLCFDLDSLEIKIFPYDD
ncbi:metallophosphoesterase family protein [Chondrinema litorale]|uniref:metallophosphoesterase family protein n=1 Tax=Chondrinema litorale TaxID=2994555 RepID=UPI0025430075|nr:metallophosphoesterase family protein [Chondrinema litorale]UZR93568.1 metallophosphoesterase family protein [Chondrinema litorale]